MRINFKAAFCGMLLSGMFVSADAQKPALETFTDVKVLESGICENQYNSGTCWSFSGMSFFQAELIRMGKGKGLNLSEMFVVRNLYPLKAENYVRMHGKANFGEGGEFTDDLLCLRRFGLVPQSVYDGNRGTGIYDHSKLVKSLDSLVTKVAAVPDVIDLGWKDKFNAMLSAQMKDAPASFEYEGKTYTPASFAKELGLNADDYVLISSFTHHPYDQPFVLEVPDNWNWERVYNVPLADLTGIAKHALENGFPVAWGSDISEKGFNYRAGVARASDGDTGKELVVTPELRQRAFDNYETQDDHAMLMVGLAKDVKGNSFFKVKNSWGEGVPSGQFFYASEAFVAYKTTSIMLNKKALSKNMLKRLGLKV